MLNPRQGLSLVARLSLWLAVGGCSRSVDPEDLPDISGAWNYAETLTAERGAVACNMVGTLGFVQEGEALVGTYIRSVTCSGTQGVTSRGESGQIPSGRVSVTSIEFRLAGCDYRGAFTKLKPDRITGTTLCVSTALTSNTLDAAASSAWSAERLDRSTP
ncbi:MAG: hypothetical protein HYT81_00610 [Gemmatimonadetes bacterium]|nr:hypothetical protein [Gemmatimonadota bacterium]